MSRPRLALVVSGFPRPSETFAINELLALQDRGLLAGIFATKPGDAGPVQPGIERLMPQVEVLPAGSPEAQGAALAARLEHKGVAGVHAYFAHTPSEVAECAARVLRVPFGFSVHAKDARKAESGALARRASSAACVVACNPDVARDLGRAGCRAHLVAHGVDLCRFHVETPRADRVLRLLAVGRLVEKKGFEILLDAMTQTTGAHLRLVGDGPGRHSLLARIHALGIADRVELAGMRTHAELPGEYAAAHAVVVPSVVDSTGDRDGLPNVVLEAMASGRPVVGTTAGAIATVVRDGETGLLVATRDAAALASAINSLAAHPEARTVMGLRGRRLVEREYELQACTRCFTGLLEAAYA
jgi:glycosyltransferase involved in cell wall biosynthesis